VLTALKVLLVMGLITAGFTLGNGSFAHLGRLPVAELDLSALPTLGLSLMWIMFAYSGWNAAAYLGSEIRDPARNLPRSLLLGTSAVLLLYLGLNVLFVYAIPPEEMAGVISVGGLAVAKLFGGASEALISILIAFALFSSLSAFIILGPRVYYSMARDRLFFSWAGDVHPRFGVPAKSVALQGVVASIMVLLGTFDQVLTYMGFSLGVFPLVAVVGVFRLRRQGASVFRMPGFPLVPMTYLVAGCAMLILSFVERPVESWIAVATVGAGIPVYALFRRRG
jgi:APA family basic amino acid/polyamine antiporter